MSFSLSPSGGSGYAGLLAARKKAKKTAGTPGVDPLGQTPQPAINALVNRTYGQPQTDTGITSTARGMLDPVVLALTKSINDRAAAASQSIRGNTESLAKELGLVDYAAPYRGGEQEQAAVDEALRASLVGEGGRLSADLKGRLAGLEDPAVAAAGDTVAGIGSGAASAELARGSASLSDMLARAAAAKSYGLKQPGLARLRGLQDIAGVEGAASQQIGDKTAELLGQLPGIVGNLRSERSSLQGNRAQLLATLLGQNITKATAKAGLAGDAVKVAADTQSMPDPSLSRAYGYQVDQYGNPVGGQVTPIPGYHVDKGGNVVKDAKTATPKALSAKDRKAALDQLDLYYYGEQPKQQYDSGLHKFVDVPGTGVPGIDYQTAVSNLMTGLGYTREQAIALANTRYRPGEDGRPMTSAQKSQRIQGREADTRGGHVAPLTPQPTKAPPAPNPNSWDPKRDPVVAAGPPGTGTARTKSGRYVDLTFGAYVNAPKGY